MQLPTGPDLERRSCDPMRKAAHAYSTVVLYEDPIVFALFTVLVAAVYLVLS